MNILPRSLLIFLIILCPEAFCQSFSSFITGNSSDTVTQPVGGVCLMGGASEHDNAIRWFLAGASGGDVLVLRATGSDGYNDYFYNQLGANIHSVETIVFHDSSASSDPYIHLQIANAEAIWFAGGDQWNYISHWRGTKIDSLINDGTSKRKVVIGGTSAGMAIQGGFYFSAENGTVLSPWVLADPYHPKATIDSTSFLKNRYLLNTITDTHYDNPDRRGRHIGFMAKAMKDWGINLYGIACDEYTAVCIDSAGNASVFGEYPSFDDNAYFLQSNCELPDRTPEACFPNNPLTWNRSGLAVRVYRVKGTSAGANGFSLMDWKTGTGGTWENWWVINGNFMTAPGNPINCGLSYLEEETPGSIYIFQNTTENTLNLELKNSRIQSYVLIDSSGNEFFREEGLSKRRISKSIEGIPPGVYFLRIQTENKEFNHRLMIK